MESARTRQPAAQHAEFQGAAIAGSGNSIRGQIGAVAATRRPAGWGVQQHDAAGGPAATHGRPAAKARPPFTAAHGHLELQGRRLDTAGAVHGGYRVYYLLRGRTWHSKGCAACGICGASGAFGVDGRPRSCIAGVEPCGVRSVFAKQKTLHPIIWQPTRKEQNAVWKNMQQLQGIVFSGEVIFFLRRMFVSLILGIEPFAMPHL